jgi:hypothetical protein
MSQPEQHCGDAADDDDDIIIAAIDNTDEPRNQRHQWLQTCDRDLLAWFCTSTQKKHSSHTFLMGGQVSYAYTNSTRRTLKTLGSDTLTANPQTKVRCKISLAGAF